MFLWFTIKACILTQTYFIYTINIYQDSLEKNRGKNPQPTFGNCRWSVVTTDKFTEGAYSEPLKTLIKFKDFKTKIEKLFTIATIQAAKTKLCT